MLWWRIRRPWLIWNSYENLFRVISYFIFIGRLAYHKLGIQAEVLADILEVEVDILDAEEGSRVVEEGKLVEVDNLRLVDIEVDSQCFVVDTRKSIIEISYT